MEMNHSKQRQHTCLTALWGKSHILEINSDQPLGHSKLVNHST